MERLVAGLVLSMLEPIFIPAVCLSETLICINVTWPNAGLLGIFSCLTFCMLQRVNFWFIAGVL